VGSLIIPIELSFYFCNPIKFFAQQKMVGRAKIDLIWFIIFSQNHAFDSNGDTPKNSMG
jgi:hypothetical protein